MDEKEKFDPHAELNGQDRNDLAAIMSMPGFKVLLRLFRASVDHIGMNLMNTPTGEDNQVVAKHRDWKVAAQVFTVMVELLNREKEIYVASIPDTTPVDAAEGLDIGEFTLDGEQMEEEEPFL